MNKILTSLIIALLILGGTLFLSKKNQIAILNARISTYKRDRISNETKFKNFILLQSSIANKSVRDLVFINPNSDTLDFNTIIDGSEKLFFRFTEANCSSCIEEEVKNLHNFIRPENEKDVILLCSYNTRILQLFLNTYGMKFQIFSITHDKNDFLSGSLLPFYFVCNKDGTIINSFVPDKTNPEMTKLFIHEFTKRKSIRP